MHFLVGEGLRVIVSGALELRQQRGGGALVDVEERRRGGCGGAGGGSREGGRLECCVVWLLGRRGALERAQQ